MKHSFFTILITVFSLLFSNPINAQDDEPKPETPKWLSNVGYWVVESNKKTPKDAIVYFYNNENMLVYKEEIRNQKLKLNRKKTLLRLKSALEEAVIAYEQGSWGQQDNILAVHLKL
ncbi:MAG: hypothetical protein EOO10_06735 [Chitinophagaceae bacterium]|nr:MAG: hypothetical protein EOO10_06735 [Chitinophagaceae bacterium]